MIVYKYFIKIALKNKSIIILYTLIFLILALINGSNIKQEETTFTETRLNIGIINNSNSELSKNLTKYLEKKNNVVDTVNDEVYIKEQIFLEVTDVVIIIPEDFDEKVFNKENSIKLYNDDRKIQSKQIENQINKFLIFANATSEKGKFDIEAVNSALKEEAKVELLKADNKVKDYGANEWFKFYFNFTSYVIIATYIAVIGLVMSDFNEEKIENRRKISSKKFLKFNKEIYLGQLTIASILTFTFILGSVVIKGRYIGEVDFVKYFINVIIFSFSILCLTFLINNITNDKFIITGLSTVLSLGVSFISGVMVPQELLGEKALMIAKFFPSYYFIKINEMKVSSFFDMKYEIFMQLLFAMTFLLIGLYFNKLKEKAQ